MAHPIVAMDEVEVRIATVIAEMTAAYALRAGLKPNHGGPEAAARMDQEIRSAIAEMAVAKHYGLYYAGHVGRLGEVDVGGLFEVRSIARERDRLIIHESDKDALPYILVRPEPGVGVHLLGWIFAKDGKQPAYLTDPTGERPPAYFVPQHKLRPMEELTPATAMERRHAAA